MEVKIAAAYIRVSTDDQLEYSPDSQIKAVRDYAKREGYLIPDEYVFREKDGISGKKADKRPAFRLMIATAKQDPPPFCAIFVWKFSRFARNQEEAIMYKNLLRKRGVDVRSISEPSSDSPFASLIERIIEWMDEYYLINLAEEVRRGMKEKSQRGEACGRPPYGYDVKDGVLVPNENATVVRYIFDRFVSGSGLRAITADLSARGVKTKTGAEPYLTWVRYILMNPAYVGKIRWNENGSSHYERVNVCAETPELSDGRHEPIIDTQTWEAAQKKLTGKDLDKYRRASGSESSVLRGLVRCGTCGATLTRIMRNGRGYLQCNAYTSGACKVSHYIQEDKAVEAILDALETCLKDETFTVAPQKPPHDRVQTDWTALIAEEKKKLDRAKAAFLDGLFTPEEYRSIKQSVDDTIAKLTAGQEQDKAEQKMSDTVQYKERTVRVMDVLRSPDVPNVEKNRALRSIIDRIVFDRASYTFDIYFLP